MQFKKLIVLIFIIIACSTTIPVQGYSSVTLQSVNKQKEVSISIVNCYYTDLDGNAIYDIVILYDLSFNDLRCHIKWLEWFFVRYTIKLDMYIELPSGYTYYYKYVIGTKFSENSYRLDLNDLAIEAGWYTLRINAKFFTGGATTGSVNYKFDPPGGSGGADPL